MVVAAAHRLPECCGFRVVLTTRASSLQTALLAGRRTVESELDHVSVSVIEDHSAYPAPRAVPEQLTDQLCYGNKPGVPGSAPVFPSLDVPEINDHRASG